LLSVGQHLTHGRRIGVRYDDGLAQFSFSFGGFRRQDVPGERMMTNDLSGSCYFEALGRALMCF